MKDKISVIETGGASLVCHKPLFSHDANYLICPCGKVIKVFSISTSECFQRLIGHTRPVTGVSHHPRVKLQILSSSLDGTVRVWDYEDGTLLLTCNFSEPLLGIFCHSFYSSVAFITKQIGNSNELFRFELKTTLADTSEPECYLIAKNISQHGDKQIGLSSTFMVISNDRRFCVYKDPDVTKRNKKISHTLKQADPSITCISCHPTDETCATGHFNGEIRIWYNITDASGVITNVRHWHSLPVGALAYTTSGSMILSGGHEAVLVQWSEERRDFLPRLGCEISNIAVSDDSTLYATSHPDNSILIITNYFTIKQTFEGFTAASQALPCGLQYDPATKACVTNGKPGHLLFYFPSIDTQLYNLDIISRNFISSVDLEKPLSRTVITKVAFTKTSTKEILMATLEFDKKCQRDQRLKFWIYDDTEQSWRLETVVTSPHSNSDVTSLNFHPSVAMCVSTSLDGLIKIWVKTDEDWFCDGTSSYRQLQAMDSAFSEDGSLLALVVGNTVAICEPDSVEDITVLTSFPVTVKSVLFGRQSCCHLLVIATLDQIQCWNMISCSIQWYSEVSDVNFLIEDKSSENMAVFTKHHKVHIFRPSDHEPLFSVDVGFDVVAACFVSDLNETIDWLKNSSLYMVSSDITVHKLSDITDHGERGNQSRPSIKSSIATPMSTLLSTKIGKIGVELTNTSTRQTTMEEAMRHVLNTPVHVLPAMSMLCDQFVSSLLFDVTKEEEKVGNPDDFSLVKRKPLEDTRGTPETNDVIMDDVTPEEIAANKKGFDWLESFFTKKFQNEQ